MEVIASAVANDPRAMVNSDSLAEIVVETDTVEETQHLARRLAESLEPGDFIALIGPLGAGKTAFVQGIAQALKVQGPVTSPTFVLMRLYRGRAPLCHVDAYRLEGSAEALVDIGLEDWLDDAVVALEWADTVIDVLPAQRLEVLLDYAESGRRIQIRGLGDRASEIVERMAGQR